LINVETTFLAGLTLLAENFYESSLDASLVSCILRLGTMSMQMLNTSGAHSRLIEATAASPAQLLPNSSAVDTRQPGFGQTLAWGCMR
jgi:hypothetical protein